MEDQTQALCGFIAGVMTAQRWTNMGLTGSEILDKMISEAPVELIEAYLAGVDLDEERADDVAVMLLKAKLQNKKGKTSGSSHECQNTAPHHHTPGRPAMKGSTPSCDRDGMKPYFN